MAINILRIPLTDLLKKIERYHDASYRLKLAADSPLRTQLQRDKCRAKAYFVHGALTAYITIAVARSEQGDYKND
jgi:hypothetical protein